MTRLCMILETKSTADLESVCPHMLVIPLWVCPRWASSSIVVYKYKKVKHFSYSQVRSPAIFVYSKNK
jgi:hypothetical protein